MKTWEMLRNIKPGDVYCLENKPESSITMGKDPDESNAYPMVYWFTGDATGRRFSCNEHTLAYEWCKVPKLVDFPEAASALLEGKRIRPADDFAPEYEDYVINSEIESYYTTFGFRVKHMRGKWEILD